MSAIPLVEQAIVPGVLKQQTFKTEQERYEAFCEASKISAQAGQNGADGKSVTGPPGPPATASTRTLTVQSGASSVNVGDDIDSAVLYNDQEIPTINIRGVYGQSIYLSGPAPTANYKVRVTSISTSES